jgi:hypothetical protein
MCNRVEFLQFGNLIFAIDLPENLPGTKQIDAATLSGQAIGSASCPACGATILLDGETPIVGTCNCA